MAKQPTDDQVAALADAMVMVLNELSEGGGVCDLVKANARLAIDPFLLDDYGEIPDMEWAQEVVGFHNNPQSK